MKNWRSHLPSEWAAALILASDPVRPALERLAQIDSVTDQLAALGHCRPRHDTSRMREWDAARIWVEYSSARGM